MKLEFSPTDFRKKKGPQTPNLMKIHPVGADMFHAIYEANSRFLQFCERVKKVYDSPTEQAYIYVFFTNFKKTPIISQYRINYLHEISIYNSG
jgi:hypothetical protein